MDNTILLKNQLLEKIEQANLQEEQLEILLQKFQEILEEKKKISRNDLPQLFEGKISILDDFNEPF